MMISVVGGIGAIVQRTLLTIWGQCMKSRDSINLGTVNELWDNSHKSGMSGHRIKLSAFF